MPNILKLNEISAVADKEFPAGYVFSKEIEKPDGIMLRSFNMHEYPLNDELLAVARAGAGTNNIPIPACTEKGIVVFNTPGANANAVKELVLCELFLGGRKIVDAIDWVKTLKGTEGISKAVEKGKSKFVGHEILGKTLGVIGLGAIGVAVANAAVDLGMKVLGYDPFLSVSGALHLDTRVQVVGLDDLLKNANFITVHVPLTPDTKQMFNADAFAKTAGRHRARQQFARRTRRQRGRARSGRKRQARALHHRLPRRGADRRQKRHLRPPPRRFYPRSGGQLRGDGGERARRLHRERQRDAQRQLPRRQRAPAPRQHAFASCTRTRKA